MPPENGTKQALDDIREQINRLWAEKASVESLKYALEDIAEMKTALKHIERVIAARPGEREKEREAAARERKLDRRWMVATALTCVGLIIAAMAILLPALGGG